MSTTTMTKTTKTTKLKNTIATFPVMLPSFSLYYNWFWFLFIRKESRMACSYIYATNFKELNLSIKQDKKNKNSTCDRIEFLVNTY